MKRLIILALCLILLLTFSACTGGGLEEAHSDDHQEHRIWDDSDIYIKYPCDDCGEYNCDDDCVFDYGFGNPLSFDFGSASDIEDRLQESKLDTSSVDAFIDGIWSKYGVVLEDNHGFLSGSYGSYRMNEIEVTLRLFSPWFIKALSDIYAGYNADLIIRVEGYNDYASGMVEWCGDLIITLFYDSNPTSGRFKRSTLAHEMGHAVHFVIEEFIGSLQSERGMEVLNGSFPYVGSRYSSEWDDFLHSTTFAYAYGMYNFYEDWATIFEVLANPNPRDMIARLTDARNEPLFLKIQYIRDLSYRYISNECWAVFFPLYEAEEYWAQAA
jgi:hypothetical protein